MAAQMMAEQVGRAARADMQLVVPTHPVMRRGVRLRRMGEAVVLDGSDRSQVFSGVFARDWLLPLTNEFDGSRDHHAIAMKLNISEAEVYKCLALLWSAGVIEEANATREQKLELQLSVLLSRLGNSTGVNPSWSDAVDKMSHASVLLEGDESLVELTKAALPSAMRLGSSPDSLLRREESLVVFFETARSAGRLKLIQETCWKRGLPLLRIRSDASSVTIGPYIDGSTTPCLDCGKSGELKLSDDVPAKVRDFVAGIAVHHIMALIARSSVTHLPGDTSTVDLETLTTRYQPVSARPGCPNCSAGKGPIGVVPAGAIYEASVALPPRQFLSPRDHQAHYYSSNLKLQSQFKDWPSRRHTPLPEPDFSMLTTAKSDDADSAPAGLTFKSLSLLLKLAFGIKIDETTIQRTKRWTAAAGNIGCTTAYVVIRDDRILTPGIYGYAAESHALTAVSTVVPDGGSPCDLIITGDLTKIMTKYGTFGFRLIFLDAGCALTTITKVTQHLGLDFSPLSDWNDDIIRASLASSAADEPVVAVASFRRNYAE